MSDMIFPVEIRFHGMSPSESVEQQVRTWAEKLELTYPRVEWCTVVVDQPHRHHARGRRFHIRIAIGVPGGTLVVSSDPGIGSAHDDAHVAIRDAFRVARRKLAIHAAHEQSHAAGVP